MQAFCSGIPGKKTGGFPASGPDQYRFLRKMKLRLEKRVNT